jgi:hypothetical protein
MLHPPVRILLKVIQIILDGDRKFISSRFEQPSQIQKGNNHADTLIAMKEAIGSF